MFTQQSLLDPLNFVSTHSRHVSIDDEAIAKYVRDFSPAHTDHWTKSYPLSPLPTLSLEDQIDLFFLMGSQAFCFWGDPKWHIEFKGTRLDGWWALVACFHRAIEEGVPITDGSYLQHLNNEQTESLFRGEPEIPLVKERKLILNSIGKALVEKYNGHFHTAFRDCKKDALSVLTLVSEFEGFDDVPLYEGKKIPFYKKAQVVVSDLDELLKTTSGSGLQGMELLPGHADYKIPAQLRMLGILRYDDDLSQIVDSLIEIPAGSALEVEIRANQLWAIHKIVDDLKAKYPTMNASTLNGILWVQSQTKKENEKPYHRTKTVYY